MTKIRKFFFALAIIPVVALMTLTGAIAQMYPSKPLTLIVTWPAGGSTDVIARLLAEPLGKELGQPVAVVNRKGGGGSLGTRAALDAPMDGYTILMTTSGNHILTPLKKDVGYRYDDFEPIGQLVAATLALAVQADSPWQNLDDMIQDVQANPGKYNFGAVPSTMPHLTLNGLISAAELDVVHIPMQGGAPGVKALLGGDIAMLPANLSSVASNLKAGKLRALAVFNATRDPAFADIATAEEQGYAVYGNPFVGLAVAKGVPEEVLDRLRAALSTVASDPEFQAKVATSGAAITYLPPDEFGAIWARDWGNFEPILKP
ncbi:MAG: tripartite tricarboxylate transporter substrate binding protein [Alphaproteobacteria bacterium]|nr:tripartite tricarboxylate transporter substrate binding protein [Alphaproteobacteria bacterium]